MSGGAHVSGLGAIVRRVRRSTAGRFGGVLTDEMGEEREEEEEKTPSPRVIIEGPLFI